MPMNIFSLLVTQVGTSLYSLIPVPDQYSHLDLYIPVCTLKIKTVLYAFKIVFSFFGGRGFV